MQRLTSLRMSSKVSSCENDTILKMLIFFSFILARIIDISIVDSNFECIDLVKQFETFKNLKHLSINRSNLKAISKCGDKDNSHKKSELSNSTSRTSSKFPRLKILDLSENKLETIENEVLEKFSSIEVLNISYNRINFINRDFFRNTKNLNVVDLSSNFLSKNLNPFSLRHLPQRLAHIDISSKMNFDFRMILVTGTNLWLFHR